MPDFKRSTNPNKKYMVKTPKGRLIHFGARDMEHYKDTTGLGLFSHLNHLDKNRREAYHKRHKAIKKKDGSYAYLDKEQPAYYSLKYLW